MIVSKQYLLFYLIHEKEVHILKIVNSRTDYLNQLDHLFRNCPITRYIEKSPD
ncbi:TPA: hypothetical protein VUP28_002088 [Streptococcus pneumoniae]|nr:hypothetical protein SP4UMMC_10895 [Streptococcus pneumoniae MNZ14]KGI25342.1 hypothetical protein BM49_2188 [Streptococcus pneumoniae]KGI34154.1 hypothetical protein X231_2214 [Streptococcus pneumoniae ECC_3510]MBW7507245.1 hypothetical protein [Streptococcus pneumoniae]MDS2450989.1 hypothetical protein [Streptococcus pneumoniae]